jgi:hypothetical protein
MGYIQFGRASFSTRTGTTSGRPRAEIHPPANQRRPTKSPPHWWSAFTGWRITPRFFLALSGFFLPFPVFSCPFRFFLAVSGFFLLFLKTGFVQNPNPSMWCGEIKSLLCLATTGSVVFLLFSSQNTIDRDTIPLNPSCQHLISRVHSVIRH